MIELDAKIVEFIGGNSTTMLIIYLLLKELAKVTPWTADDSIVRALGSVFTILTGKKSNGK